MMYSASAESSAAPVLHPTSASLGCTAFWRASANGVPVATSTDMLTVSVSFELLTMIRVATECKSVVRRREFLGDVS